MIMENGEIINAVRELGLFSQKQSEYVLKKIETLDVDSIDKTKFNNWFKSKKITICKADNPGTYFVKSVATGIKEGTFKKQQKPAPEPVTPSPVSHGDQAWMSDIGELIRIAKTPWLDDADDVD